jgi:hypothetical protein
VIIILLDPYLFSTALLSTYESVLKDLVSAIIYQIWGFLRVLRVDFDGLGSLGNSWGILGLAGELGESRDDPELSSGNGSRFGNYI